jgi:HAMP domain-containing protein
MARLALDLLHGLTELYHSFEKENVHRVPLNQAVEWTAMDPLRLQLQAMLETEDQLLGLRRVWNKQTDQQMQLMLFVSVVVGLFGGLIVNFLFTSGIGRRIGLIEKNARRLATGDPMYPLPPAKDEIGRLHVSLKKTAELLARKSREVLQIAARERSACEFLNN